MPARAALVSRAAGVVAGLAALPMTLDAVADRLGSGKAASSLEAQDGHAVGPGQVLARVEGPAATLLAAERTALNILGHLSGVATLTSEAVAAVTGSGVVVRDTRKTLPGLRALEKYAVRCGGGQNHRMSLSDAILVKDNHVAALGGVQPAVAAARATAAGAGLTLEVEVDSLSELDQALRAGAQLVLLDNMGLADMTEAVRRAAPYGARLEASGRLTLASLAAVAATGVDFVAMGALTHSAPALDLGLDWELGPAAPR